MLMDKREYCKFFSLRRNFSIPLKIAFKSVKINFRQSKYTKNLSNTEKIKTLRTRGFPPGDFPPGDFFFLGMNPW